MKVPAEVADEFLRKLDLAEDQHPGDFISFSTLVQMVGSLEGIVPEDVSIPELIEEFQKRDWIESDGNGFDIVEQSFRITAKGQIRAAASVDYAKYFERMVTSLPTLDSVDSVSKDLNISDQTRAVVVPAANRIVNLDHNSPDVQLVSRELKLLLEEVRGNNEIGETAEQRDRFRRSMEAANELWASAELQFVQIEIGVMLAVEQVGIALAAIGKAVGVALIVDAIKAVVKKATGIDF